MEKEFAPYQQSLELKGLEFNEPCLGAHGPWGFMPPNDVNSLSDDVRQEDLDNQGYNEEDGVCLAPLYSQAFRWFREKHEWYANLSSWLHEEEIGTYHDFEIYGTNQYTHSGGQFKTYEEAELACLNKLIEIVKNKL